MTQRLNAVLEVVFSFPELTVGEFCAIKQQMLIAASEVARKLGGRVDDSTLSGNAYNSPIPS